MLFFRFVVVFVNWKTLVKTRWYRRRGVCSFSPAMEQRCADPQISRPRIIRVRTHQVRGRSASATVMATHVRGVRTVRIRKKGRITLYPIDNAYGPTQSNRLSYITARPTAVFKCGSVLKLLRTGTLALPFEVGPANNIRGFRSADGPRPQMCLFGGSADHPRPQSAHLCHGALDVATVSMPRQ